MTPWGVAAGCLLLALGACGNGGTVAPETTHAPSSTSSTAPERPTSTTTTTYAPDTTEGEVEAAYLRSWDVYAEAVCNLELDEQALAEVYAGEALTIRVRELEHRAKEERAAFVLVDHDYTITVSGEAADVLDGFTNHQVLIDPATKRPTEADPNERLLVHFRMHRTNGVWRVILIEKVLL